MNKDEEKKINKTGSLQTTGFQALDEEWINTRRVKKALANGRQK